MSTVNQREVAHRIFAAELNASRVEVKGTDERAPSYLVSPLGARMNRVFVCGVLTEVENTAQDGEMWRARINDPTGTFTVYAGQYQPEAAAALSQLNPPQYVAIIGKARVYEPEPGRIFISIRPESVQVIDEDLRNQWVLDTARHTRDRVRATKAVAVEGNTSPAQLEAGGVGKHLVAGVLLAHERYEGDVDLEYFQRTIGDALRGLVEGGPSLDTPAPRAAPMPTSRPMVAAKPKPKGPGEEVEKQVLSVIESMATRDEKGAQWDLIVAEGEKQKITEDQIEEALNSLMDKGLIYEPILGRLKLT